MTNDTLQALAELFFEQNSGRACIEGGMLVYAFWDTLTDTDREALTLTELGYMYHNPSFSRN